MEAIQCIVILTIGYVFGAYSMYMSSRHQIREAYAVRENALRDLREAQRLFRLTILAISSGVVPDDWEDDPDDESKTDQTSV